MGKLQIKIYDEFDLNRPFLDSKWYDSKQTKEMKRVFRNQIERIRQRHIHTVFVTPFGISIKKRGIKRPK